MEKIRLRRVVETGLRLAAVALLIGAVVMTGVGMFGVAAISGLNPESAVKVLLVTLVAPVVGAIVLWRAADHVIRGGRGSGR